MRGALYLRAGIDCGGVLRGWDVDMGDRICDLLLEENLRLPGHAGLCATLHQKKRVAERNARLDTINPGRTGGPQSRLLRYPAQGSQ
jgi:hypothetical protein